MDSFYNLARQVFDAQPFSCWLGAQLTRAKADGVTLVLPIADHHKQQHGFVHGGVISYLADNSLKGARLEARAKARSTGRRQAVCHSEIYVIEDGQETLCALAQGTITSLGK